MPTPAWIPPSGIMCTLVRRSRSDQRAWRGDPSRVRNRRCIRLALVNPRPRNPPIPRAVGCGEAVRQLLPTNPRRRVRCSGPPINTQQPPIAHPPSSSHRGQSHNRETHHPTFRRVRCSGPPFTTQQPPITHPPSSSHRNQSHDRETHQSR